MQCGALCQPADLTAASDIDLGPWEDALSALIAAASQAVCDFAGREFAPASDAEATRVFLVPADPAWPRTISVGDLAKLAGLTVDAQAATLPADVTPCPLNRGPAEPITELVIGDALPFRRGARIEVTGVWGWPDVPEVARLATVDTVRGWLKAGMLPNVPVGADDTGVTSGLSLTAMRLLRPVREIPVA